MPLNVTCMKEGQLEHMLQLNRVGKWLGCMHGGGGRCKLTVYYICLFFLMRVLSPNSQFL